MKLFILTISLISCSMNGLCINPEREYKYFPADFGIASYLEANVQTADNYNIRLWEFSPQKKVKNKIIIISNGDGGNMSYSLYYVKNLLDMGYAVVTYDYRGFGESDDFKSENDFLYYKEYVSDLKAVIDFTRKKYGFKKKLVLMSFSMGTIVTTLVLDEEKIDFVIVDDLVIDPELAKKRLKKHYNKAYKVPDTSIDFIKRLENLNLPMLVFSGKRDLITTNEDSKKVVQAYPFNRELVIHEAGHGEALRALTNDSLGDVYFQKIEQFLTN